MLLKCGPAFSLNYVDVWNSDDGERQESWWASTQCWLHMMNEQHSFKTIFVVLLFERQCYTHTQRMREMGRSSYSWLTLQMAAMARVGQTKVRKQQLLLGVLHRCQSPSNWAFLCCFLEHINKALEKWSWDLKWHPNGML